MIKWAAIGAAFVIAAWLIYPNNMGIRPSNDVPRASALCKDATLSYSTSRSGTCSGKGGVEEWME